MKNFLSFISGCLALTVFATNTIFWSLALVPVTVLKLILPFRSVKNYLAYLATKIGNFWIFWNSFGLKAAKKIEVEIQCSDEFDPKSWYLVICNHQSWVDIPILQWVLYKKVPFIKFFLKKELIWVPLLGAAWWALDYPFMKRYTLDQIRKNPSLINKDKETAKKACDKFKSHPTTVMTFIEGTRFSPEKKIKSKSPYEYLMRPKAAAAGLILTNMQDKLDGIINVTLCYPEGSQEIWPFLCGKIRKVIVKMEKIEMDDSLKGDYYNDAAYKKSLQKWLNSIWKEKDAFIKENSVKS